MSNQQIVLNTNQRRHFEVLFARLEDSITRIQGLLDRGGPGDHRILSLLDDDVPEGFGTTASDVLGQIRAQIAELTATLDLKPRRMSRRRAIAAALTSEAIRLEDSLSPQLRGYGALDPSVAQHLDPVLAEMASTLTRLASHLRHAQ